MLVSLRNTSFAMICHILILVFLCRYVDLHIMHPLMVSHYEISKNLTRAEISSVSADHRFVHGRSDDSDVIRKLYQLDIICDDLSIGGKTSLSYLCDSSLAVVFAEDYPSLLALQEPLNEIFEVNITFHSLSQNRYQMIRPERLSDHQQLVLYPSLKLLLDSKKDKKPDPRTRSSSIMNRVFSKPGKRARLSDDDTQVLQLYESLRRRNNAAKSFRTHAQKIFDKFVRSYQPYRRLRIKVHDQLHASSMAEIDVSVLASCDDLRRAVAQHIGQSTEATRMMLHVHGQLETLPSSQLSLLSLGCVPPGFKLQVG